MRIFRHGILAIALLAGASAGRAQLVTYTFGSSGSPTTNANSVSAHLAASVFSGLSGSPATGSGSPVYSAGSGGSFFTATAWTGAAPGTNYFQFTLTPNTNFDFSVTSIALGYRATNTGPTALSIRSSADSFASNLATAVVTDDSAWHGTGNLSITLSSLSSATTFRIYGSGASSSAGTLRVDDITLNGSVSAIPEPSTYAAILGSLALGGAALRRQRHRIRA